MFPQPGPAASSNDARRLAETWLGARRASAARDPITVGAERSITEEPRVQASLPKGRAMRVDDLPGVLIFEDIPAPKLVLGPVERSPSGAWIADVRGAPAVLVMEVGSRELALWGERGEMRLFSVERCD